MTTGLLGRRRKLRLARRWPAKPPRLGAVSVALVLAMAAPEVAAATSEAAPPAPQPAAYRDQPPLAYVSGGQVFVLDGEGHAPLRVRGATGACCVAWAPDGAYLAFQQHGDLWVAERNGTETRRVARAVQRWAWAPDGQALAVIPKPSPGSDAGRGIVFYGAEDPAVRETQLRGYRVLDLAWAGLGRRIAVSAVPPGMAARADSPAEVFMLEVPGPYGEDCPALCPEPPVPIPVEQGVASSGPLFAGWSPNVDAIALWTAPGDGPNLGLLSPAGGGVVPIAATLVRRSWVQWSRAGDRLLVVEGLARGPGAPRALLLCTTGTACRSITGQDDSAADPAWSGAGAMAYVRSAHRQLWVADGDGADARRLTTAGEGVATPLWLPDARHLVFVRDGLVWLLDTAAGATSTGAVPVAGPLGPGRETPPASAGETTDDSTGPRSPMWEQLYAVAP